jgi:hypothetical protein
LEFEFLAVGDSTVLRNFSGISLEISNEKKFKNFGDKFKVVSIQFQIQITRFLSSFHSKPSSKITTTSSDTNGIKAKQSKPKNSSRRFLYFS